jgi:Protein of unknown function (DUF3843)
MRKSNKILLKNWMVLHPYKKPYKSDFYYLKLSNEILDVLLAAGMDFWDELLDTEDLKELARFICCYFEDVISGPGLWRGFTRAMEDLYDRPLPFFPVDSEYYLAEEINLEDVYFLLWYFVSMKRGGDLVVSPFFHELSDVSENIMDILDREYEQAPENEFLSDLYRLGPNDNLHVLNQRMRWIVLGSWLFHFHAQDLDEMLEFQFEKMGGDAPSPELLDKYIYDITDSYVQSVHTSLLALKAKDWLALLAGENHPLYREIKGLSGKKSGYYLFEGEGKSGVYLFRHLATQTLLEVSGNSMSIPEAMHPDKSIVYAGFIAWKKQWWLSGAMIIWGDKGHRDVPDEKLKEEAFLFADLNDSEGREKQKEYDAFMEFNKGKPMAFKENPVEMDAFVNQFFEFYLSQYTDEGVLEGRSPEMDQHQQIPGMLFASPVSGIQIVYGLNACIPDEHNPWYDEKQAADISERLWYSPHVNGEWVCYLLENFSIPPPEFPGIVSNEMINEDIDFMLRFWKMKAY